jgi:hypothetical protein
LADEGFTQAIESSNICVIQAHIPFQSGTGQSVLEVMNQQLMIIRFSGHLSGIHYQMALRTRVSSILFKPGDFELGRNSDI